ncbi:hypothetical protein [Wenyingzhuangia sp. IMCC45467]
MKKIITLSILLVIIACKTNKPKGLWISYKSKALTPENGYSPSTSSLILNFDKLEFYNLSDSVKNFSINSNLIMFYNNSDTVKLDYLLLEKDSLEINIRELNTTKIFIPLKLNTKLNLSKNKIRNKLTEQKFYSVKDTLKLTFTEDFYTDEYSKKEITNKRILKSKFLTNNEFHGYWYIGQIEENYFIIMNLTPERIGSKEVIYQITKIENSKIKIKPIVTPIGFANRINEIKASL